jgi:hypothetical protein
LLLLLLLLLLFCLQHLHGLLTRAQLRTAGA